MCFKTQNLIAQSFIDLILCDFYKSFDFCVPIFDKKIVKFYR